MGEIKGERREGVTRKDERNGTHVARAPFGERSAKRKTLFTLFYVVALRVLAEQRNTRATEDPHRPRLFRVPRRSRYNVTFPLLSLSLYSSPCTGVNGHSTRLERSERAITLRALV